jgi:CBS domain-containing protein
MRKNEPITNIISKDVKSAEQGQPLSHVSQIMSDYGIHHVPVVNAGKLVGIVSFTDMMKLNLLTGTAPKQTIGVILDRQFTIKDVMTTDVYSVNKKDTVRSATEILSAGKFHSLPVVDDDNSLVGIVTSTDLIRYLGEQY